MKSSEVAPRYPSPGTAWLLVSLLTIAYVVSFVDRYILSLLVEPIKADLGLTDFQIGLLLGPAFGIFYATMGLPLGYLADRSRRTWIVSAGIAIWSAATALSGLARSFVQMFVARVSVGVGEATLSPLRDVADRRRLSPGPARQADRPVLERHIGRLRARGAAWRRRADLGRRRRIARIAVRRLARALEDGVSHRRSAGDSCWPPIFFLLREPARIGASANREPRHLGHMLRHVARHILTYGCFVAVFCYMTITAYSHGWLAVTFQRTWGWPVETYALYNGLTLIVVGPASVMFAGWLSDRLTQRGQADAPLRIALLGLFLSMPPAVIGPLLDSAVAAFVVLSTFTVGAAFISAVGVTALLQIVPSRIRAQTISLYYMTISLTGLFLGPSLVGLLNDAVFGEDGVRYSVALIPLIFGLPVMLIAPLTLRLYRSALGRLNRED